MKIEQIEKLGKKVMSKRELKNYDINIVIDYVRQNRENEKANYNLDTALGLILSGKIKGSNIIYKKYGNIDEDVATIAYQQVYFGILDCDTSFSPTLITSWFKTSYLHRYLDFQNKWNNKRIAPITLVDDPICEVDGVYFDEIDILHDRFNRCIKRLKDNTEKKVIYERYYNKKAIRTIAKDLKMRDSTVVKIIKTALENLRSIVEEDTNYKYILEVL